MINKPLISILTPTYNHENFIGNCIESVLAQTYTNWEQIIIDDGSIDETEKVVSRYEDNRIKYVKQDHVGIWKLNETYNHALSHTKGEIIAILEGDDFWPTYKLESQITAFSNREVVLSWGKASITNSEGKTIVVVPTNIKWFKNKSDISLLKKLLFRNYIPACTVMCRKDSLLSIGGFKQPKDIILVDWPTWLELSLYGKLLPINEILGYWRQHENQVTRAMITGKCNPTKYAIDFFNRMPQELKESIKISKNDLIINYNNEVGSVAFNLGRIKLMEKNWDEAKNKFNEAFDKGSFRIKNMAIFGLICSYCRIDLEWAATLLNRQSLDIF
jgi:glycosyltransferase involved in cell wall biosynthesis